MVPGEAQQALRRGRLGRQAGDEVDDLDAGLAGGLARALDAGHPGEARPGQIGDDLAADRDLTGLDAAAALLHRLGRATSGGGSSQGGSVGRRRWRSPSARSVAATTCLSGTPPAPLLLPLTRWTALFLSSFRPVNPSPPVK